MLEIQFFYSKDKCMPTRDTKDRSNEMVTTVLLNACSMIHSVLHIPNGSFFCTASVTCRSVS